MKPDKNKFEISLDVSQFATDEVNVGVEDQNVIVEVSECNAALIEENHVCRIMQSSLLRYSEKNL